LNKTSKASDPFYVLAGQAIRKVRESKGVSQEQLGKAIELSRTSINNMENGRQKMLLDTFCEIAKVLGEEPPALLALCCSSENSSTADKRLRGLSPEEQQFIQEGIAQSRRKK